LVGKQTVDNVSFSANLLLSEMRVSFVWSVYYCTIKHSVSYLIGKVIIDFL
jgi:hypothetical protein